MPDIPLVFLLTALTLAPALANWLALWVLNDAWLAIVLCAVIFYGGAYWTISAFKLKRNITLTRQKMGISLGWGLASAVAVAISIIAVGNVYFTKALPGNMLQVCSQRLHQSQALRLSFWCFFLAVAVLLPIGEEMYWRAGLQGLLVSRLSRSGAIFMSAVMFTMYHMVTVGFLMPGWPGMPLLASVLAGGLIFAWLTEHTGNIWAAAICHGLGAWGAAIYLVWKHLR
jgi:membrane protease YdiL (CAAX protease family)